MDAKLRLYDIDLLVCEKRKTMSYIWVKGEFDMMDCLMVATMLAGFGLVWLLLEWCHKQVESQE